MASQLSWLDHDASAAQRSLQILSLFNEPDARDELGIGGIRDSIADQLFPGTSTIQTRLRYVFFVPWLLDQLESRNTSSSAFPGAARAAELRLLEQLIAHAPPNEPGIIGREARGDLKRLPSSVYWAALGSWGMRRSRVSLQQYFGLADRRYAQRRTLRRRDDGESYDGDQAGRPWDEKLVALRPECFPVAASLQLTRDEAAFLLDRWTLKHRDSLLTRLAHELAKGAAVSDAEQIWMHPDRERFPQTIRSLIDDAHRLSVLIRGAALLYNLELARLAPRRENIIDERAPELAAWAAEELPLCAGWDLNSFWARVVGKGHTITRPTQDFVHNWLDLALREHKRVAESTDCRQLIRARESSIKSGGNRSRFGNMAARAQWSGKAGLVPLSYRWPVARDFLREWHAGWSAA
ncbi:DUF6361 family protein [Paraburkholderia sp. SIMBA_053]|uniref:DUF6361 family protein n=1 Tax=Paraburkholderia sp. SIMBA_053 TaxID=3085794 RepID=UPI00397955D0